jgi:hypothetical protein
LQQQIVIVEKVLQQGQVCVADFSGVVDYNFKLWTHLQNALEINAIDNQINTIKAQIDQKKQALLLVP